MSQPLTRRGVAVLGAAAAIGAALPLRRARAAEFVFKWGTNVPESRPLNVHAHRAAEEIRRATDGRFDLQFFADNQLGGDTDMFSQLRSGALECFTLSGVNVLSTLIPSASIYGLGFAFKDYPALWTSLFKSLGAAPTGINFAEVYLALQTRIVDGQENPLAIISAAKLYKVQKFCSLTNHVWDGWWFLVNRRAWARVPGDVQETVSRIVNAAAVDERAEVPRQNGALRDELVANGLAFSEVDPAPFREMLRKSGFYAEWKSKFGEEAWALLEESTGKLA